MAEGKEGFVLYRDLIHTVSKLPDAEAGKLFKHILAYVNDKNPVTDDMIVEIAFEPVKQQLKRDLRKYEEKCRKNKENVEKRWNDKDTTVYDRIRSITKHTDKDIDKDKEKDLLFSEQSSEVVLSKLLYSLMLNNNPKAKQPNFQSWAKHIDLMFRIDNRTYEEIEGAINWSQQDSFWQNNILSTDKLRKQFDKLYLRAKNGTNQSGISKDRLRAITESIHNDPDLIR